jgi:putative hydrolase of HD superfamily
LFHDLSEVLTRDIISPVKNSVEGLDDLIRRYERQAMEEKIYPLLPDSWAREIGYFTEDEFRNKIWPEKADSPTVLDGTDIDASYNSPEWNPIDGRIIEACDKLSAYIEASLSIRLGISSSALVEGRGKIYQRFNRARSRAFTWNAVRLFPLNVVEIAEARRRAYGRGDRDRPFVGIEPRRVERSGVGGRSRSSRK